MSVDFADDHVVGRLLSPAMSLYEDICLTFIAQSEGDLLYITINTASAPDILVYFDDIGQYEGVVRLPMGNYSIEFGAYSLLSVSHQHPVELLSVRTEKKPCSTNGMCKPAYWLNFHAIAVI